MQENEFEKGIREKMNELRLVPGEDVWEHISAQIDKEKRRKRFLAFLLAFGLLLGSAGTYFYIHSNNTKPAFAANDRVVKPANSANEQRSNSTKEQAVNSTNEQPDNSTKENPVDPTKEEPVNDASASNKTTKVIWHGGQLKLANEEVDNSRSNATPGFERNIGTKNIRAGNSGQTAIQSGITGAGVEKMKAVSDMPKEDKSKIETGRQIEQVNSVQEKVIANIDSLRENQTGNPNAAARRDSLSAGVSESKVSQKIRIASNKKWNIGFAAFAGISDNVTGFKIGPSAAAYLSTSPANSSNGAAFSFINKPDYKTGYSYAFAVYLKKMVSNKTGFSAGLGYHFASATSLAGNRTSVATTFYDASLQNRSTVNEFYSSGQSSRYRNKYHLVEFPFNFLLQLNKDRNKQLVFSAGLSPAYLVASTALYANISQNVYYEAGDQFKKLQLAAQTGLQFTVANAGRFNLTAGPEVKYGLTNMAKKATSTNQHLFSAGVKVNVVLK